MKKVIFVLASAFLFSGLAYVVAQQVNAKSVTAEARCNTRYCK